VLRGGQQGWLAGIRSIGMTGTPARQGGPEASLAALLRSSIIIILSQEYLDRFILRKI
jgi:hypothetical protein